MSNYGNNRRNNQVSRANFFGSSSSNNRHTGKSSRNREEDLNDQHDIRTLNGRVNSMQLLTRTQRGDIDSDRQTVIGKSSRIQQSPTQPSSASNNISIMPRSASSIGRKEDTTTDTLPAAPQEGISASRSRMTERMKFFSDVNEVSDSLLEFLCNGENYNVVCAIGPQGTGKSTVLSMLAGNSSQDMYRDYVFRPVSREANEQSRYQTLKIEIFVTHSNLILIDCQPTNCCSIMEDASRSGKLDDNKAQLETTKLIAFLINISHTVLVCCDWFIDMNLIKTIRTSELIRPCLSSLDCRLAHNRLTNIVFVNTKAQVIDFAPRVRSERARLLRAIFRDSRWIRVSDDDELVFVPLEEIKPRKDASSQYTEMLSPEKTQENSEVESFDTTIKKLRVSLFEMRRDRFTVESGAMDQNKWLSMCKAVWNDPVLASSLENLRTYLKS